jgi:hypothetical protein
MPIKFVKIVCFSFIIFVGHFVLANAKSSPLQESVSIDFTLSGDLTGQYSLSGPVNTKLESESSVENSQCKITALVRKVLQKKSISVEMWPELNCTIEGQNKIFKLHRIYVVVDKENQTHVIKSIDMKLQKIEFKFQTVSLKKNK